MNIITTYLIIIIRIKIVKSILSDSYPATTFSSLCIYIYFFFFLSF